MGLDFKDDLANLEFLSYCQVRPDCIDEISCLGGSMIRPRIRTVVPALLLLMAPVVGAAQDLAVTHTSVYSSPEAPVLRDVTVLIRNGNIAGVGRHERIPEEVQTIPCAGCYVLAGLSSTWISYEKCRRGSEVVTR
jgi:hypothetical protein